MTKAPLEDPFDPNEMVVYAGEIALQMAIDMPEEEAVLMVRDFIGVLSEWQPSIAQHAGDPTMIAISALATTRLFEHAFQKAYRFSEKQIEARDAIKKALGEIE